MQDRKGQGTQINKCIIYVYIHDICALVCRYYIDMWQRSLIYTFYLIRAMRTLQERMIVALRAGGVLWCSAGGLCVWGLFCRQLSPPAKQKSHG